MVNKVAIQTERYDTLVSNIESSATDCLFKDEDFLDYDKTTGTDIAEFLSCKADRVNELTKMYQAQASVVLVSKLDELKKNIVATDKAVANRMTIGKGPYNVEQ
jgi:hypothetical protein